MSPVTSTETVHFIGAYPLSQTTISQSLLETTFTRDYPESNRTLRFGDATTYLPGRRVTGIAVKGETVRVSVRAKWGVPASDLLDQITAALMPSLADRRIELVVAEIDDPPRLASPEPFAPPVGTNASLPAAVDAVHSTNPSNSALTPAPPPAP